MIYRPAAALAAITWLPLLILSLVQGTAAGSVTLPFLSDFTAHVRFLFALPMLIIADVPVDYRLNRSFLQFIRAGLVRNEDLPYFHSAARTARRLTSSDLIEALLFILAFAVMFANTQMEISRTLSSWHTYGEPQFAGLWYRTISLPLFRFFMFRWIWRLAVWFWFLGRASRLELQLIATHPDRAGGLGFLNISQIQFGLIIFAFASVVSAALGKRLIYEKLSLASFAALIIVFMVLSVALLLGPLLVFTRKLLRARRNALWEYGIFAEQYTKTFEQKWVRGEPRGDKAVGSSDIQSLADLANSFEVIRRMRPFPFGHESVIVLALSAIVPMLPLSLALFPAGELLKRIIKILL